jgi:hypothetical protein
LHRPTTVHSTSGRAGGAPRLHRASVPGKSPLPGSLSPRTTIATGVVWPKAFQVDEAGMASECRGAERRKSFSGKSSRASSEQRHRSSQSGVRLRGRSSRWLSAVVPGERRSTALPPWRSAQVATEHPRDRGESLPPCPDRRPISSALRLHARARRSARARMRRRPSRGRQLFG